jgi:hypothetical protein
MKIIIIIGVVLAGIYFWNHRSNSTNTEISASQCASMGGKLTEHGCETPMTDASCEALGGKLQNGSCQVSMTAADCKNVGGTLSANGDCLR